MPVVRLKKGKLRWDILVPDQTDDEAERFALMLANGHDTGFKDQVLATNGRSGEALKTDRRRVRDGGKPRKLASRELWETDEVMPDMSFSNAPHNLAPPVPLEGEETV